jgi:hypothetical protein
LVYVVTFYRFLINNIRTEKIRSISQVIIDDVAFNVYSVVYRGKSYRLCVLNDLVINENLIKGNISKTVTHACICTFDKQGEMVDYISDITEQLNCFRIHFEGNEKILWRHVILFVTENKICFANQCLYVNVAGQETKYMINDIMQMPFLVSF